MSKNIITDKSFQFAIRIVKLYKYLCQKNEFTLSKQLLRLKTSVRANVQEGTFAQSTNNFIANFSISPKEAKQSLYWIKLLTATNYSIKTEAKTLTQECNEIIAILTSNNKSN